MTKTKSLGRTLTIAIAAALAVPVLPAVTGTSSQAHADGVRVRIGGGVRIRVGGPRVRYRHRYRRVRRPRRVYVGGFYYYRFATPPPPPPPADCYAPSYYSRPAAPPPVTVRAAAQPQKPLPRFGVGLSAGRYESDDGHEADEVGLFARFRLADPLEVEVETSKTEHDDGARIDKRLGAALYIDFAPRNDWSPYVLGGLGVVDTEIGGGAVELERNYGEVGAGLRWNLSDSFALAGDIRVGAIAADDQDERDVVLLAPEQPSVEDEEYTRAQIRGILYF